ncbi:hypothetical protein AAHE18_06G055300 [Arachis hypogaea]
MGSGIQAAKSSRKPSVAAIDGLALGGGLEVAMVANFCNDEDDESFWSRWIKPDAIVQAEPLWSSFKKQCYMLEIQKQKETDRLVLL